MQIMKQIGSIENIRKFNVKFDNSFVWQVAEMLAVSPHFHGQVATCGDWQQGCPPWFYSMSRICYSLTSYPFINSRTFSSQKLFLRHHFLTRMTHANQLLTKASIGSSISLCYILNAESTFLRYLVFLRITYEIVIFRPLYFSPVNIETMCF
jgi:hypothetical protein